MIISWKCIKKIKREVNKDLSIPKASLKSNDTIMYLLKKKNIAIKLRNQRRKEIKTGNEKAYSTVPWKFNP